MLADNLPQAVGWMLYTGGQIVGVMIATSIVPVAMLLYILKALRT